MEPAIAVSTSTFVAKIANNTTDVIIYERK